MNVLLTPPPVREKLGDAATDGLITMFADAYRLSNEGFERRLAGVEERVIDRFERRLAEEIGALREQMTQQLSALRFDLLKWSFLFWLGQFAALTAVLSFLLK